MLGFWMGKNIQIAKLALWIMTNSSKMLIYILYFKSLEMLKVKDIFDVQCLKLWHKFVNKLYNLNYQFNSWTIKYGSHNPWLI